MRSNTSMIDKRIRVLVDLSIAARGYCGIAQDVRLLYKALASCPELEVTGLIYLPRRLRPSHRFLPADAHRGERLANQACFLWEFGDESARWPPIKPLRALKNWYQTAATVLASRVQFDPLEMEIFWDFVWRTLFSRTLSASDIPLVRNGKFLLSNLCNGMIQSRVLLRRRPLKLDTRGYDFLIVQDPRPLRLSGGTRQIVRYHDLVPVLRPDTINSPFNSSWFIKWHHLAIRQQSPSTVFVCNSEPTRYDLTFAYPELERASTTIPSILSEAYRPDPNPDLIRMIIERRRSSACGATAREPLTGAPQYLMCVSTLEPRKNYVSLIQAFNAAKATSAIKQRAPELKLLIVGSPGWKYEPILSAMRDGVERGEILHLEQVSPDEIRSLYTHASAFVFPSNYEGFGHPPLEAMQCGTPVIASDIAAHRWVLGDAALYCNPYDVASIAAAIERLVASDDSTELRNELVSRGFQRVKLYSRERCARAWVELLSRLKTESATAGVVETPRDVPSPLKQVA